MTCLNATMVTLVFLLFVVSCSDSRKIKAETQKLTDKLSQIENENHEINADYVNKKATANQFIEILRSSLPTGGSSNTPQSLSEIQAVLELQIVSLEKAKIQLLDEVKLQRSELELYRATYLAPKSK